MTEKLFEAALGIGAPWFVAGADFNAQARTLTIRVDFAPGTRFEVVDFHGVHHIRWWTPSSPLPSRPARWDAQPITSEAQPAGLGEGNRTHISERESGLLQGAGSARARSHTGERVAGQTDAKVRGLAAHCVPVHWQRMGRGRIVTVGHPVAAGWSTIVETGPRDQGALERTLRIAVHRCGTATILERRLDASRSAFGHLAN